MKIVLINKSIMRPDKASGCKRLFAILEILSKNNEIHYFPESKIEGEEKYKKMLFDIGAKVYDSKFTTLLNTIKHKHFDMFFLEFYGIANEYMNIIKTYQPAAVIVTDSVDVHFARFKKEVDAGLRKEKYYLKEKTKEIDTYKKSDITVVVSMEDGELLKKEGIDRYLVISNIVPIKQRKQYSRTVPIITFVGGFGHPPNIHALKWFLDEVLDKIKQTLPNVIFKIAGHYLPDKFRNKIEKIPNVYYLDYVPDLTQLYDETVVVIAPLTYGGGVKGKVNEAMANGIPLVTTSVGVQGIPAIDGVHCFIADEADGFSLRVVELIKDIELQEVFSRNSQELAKITCGIDNAQVQIDRLMSDVNIISKGIITKKHHKNIFYDVFIIIEHYVSYYVSYSFTLLKRVVKRFLKMIIRF